MKLIKSNLIILAIILLLFAGVMGWPRFINDRQIKSQEAVKNEPEEQKTQNINNVDNIFESEPPDKNTEVAASGIEINAVEEQEKAEQGVVRREEETGTAAAGKSEPVTAEADNIIDNISKEDNIKYKKVITTVFWVGEEETADNGFIHNSSSAWDTDWEGHYGGVDDPDDRCGYRPCAFIPRENPFYFALPYDDFNDDGERKISAGNIPWFYEAGENASLVKNRWIEIRYSGRLCYGQWEDVGPFESDDFEYVFGNSPPKNPYDLKAGLDVSPALEDCLSFDGAAAVEWRFVKPEEVPSGPWKEIITTSGVSW